MWLGESYDLVADYVDQYSTAVYIAIAVAIVAFFVFLLMRARRRKKSPQDATQDDTEGTDDEILDEDQAQSSVNRGSTRA